MGEFAMKRARFFGSMMRYGAVAAAVLAIAGCGGGGGGSDGGATIDITAANEDTLAHAAAVGVQGGLLLDTAGELTLRTRDTALDVLRRPAAGSPREGPQAMMGPFTEPCGIAGTHSMMFDDQNNDGQLGIGEAVNVQLVACEDTAGEMMNGSMELTITRVTMTGMTVESFGAMATFGNLVLSDAGTGHAATYNGGATLDVLGMSTTAPVTRLTITNALSIQVVNPPFDDTVTLRRAYLLEATSDLMAGTVRTTAQGDIESRIAMGRVQLSTPQPIVQASTQPYPHQGRVELHGRTGSLTLSALPTNQIRIEADYDGNGTVDRLRDQDWSWLF
jgi:hypothetical protein